MALQPQNGSKDDGTIGGADRIGISAALAVAVGCIWFALVLVSTESVRNRRQMRLR